MPYKRSRDQKRWKNHAKKQISKEETAERMRKWRAANRDKNKRNDLRCRVYRLARQKFGDDDYLEKQIFIQDQINRRLGRQRSLMEKAANLLNSSSTTDPGLPSLSSSPSSSISSSPSSSPSSSSSSRRLHPNFYCQEKLLPFYNAPHDQIVLPTIASFRPTYFDKLNKKPTFFPLLMINLPPIQSTNYHNHKPFSILPPLLLQPNPITVHYPSLPLKL
ncbi:uncharacterized protein BX664DRAFT_375802 [Halteromyces radiatus]|uniref:uncharacterized protein n=1 Tax=Halteromyces radiatus TaxID=101107 RepID=UPI002220D20F|nr:uncharacterized protein BX664DRAFT_375802 [Halteromyces radiatus]KAI8082838.1 hypothetical protein BX664DRAFT_375802 [Halteromyces radiatus]